jgi:predicted RNase H-like HicB family nuclease
MTEAELLEMIANAQEVEVLELLIEDYEATGKPLPAPQILQAV